jgi:hypothetical protein
MRVSELLNEGVFSNSETKLFDRFTELGIKPAAQYFLDWMYHGRFNLSYSKLDRFEAAFYAINSVLPPKIIKSYGRLPTMYRALGFTKQQLQKIDKGGIPIQSRIMAWTPDFDTAADYLDYTNTPGHTGVVIKHQPKQDEVILSMTPETEKFLGVTKFIVANTGETILSLPMLKITPEMVAKIVK